MTAADHLQPQQLQMFMRPSEMRQMDRFEFGDMIDYTSESAMMRDKLTDARENGLTRSIREKGVRDPVLIAHDRVGPVLFNGHHRFAVQDRRERAGIETYLPVEHDDIPAAYDHRKVYGTRYT
jgi:hypothetical protein